jgi:hypothetical protein
MIPLQVWRPKKRACRPVYIASYTLYNSSAVRERERRYEAYEDAITDVLTYCRSHLVMLTQVT